MREKVGEVDVLINNAGITRDMTFKKMDKVNWDAVLRTNLDNLFNMSKAGGRRHDRARLGPVINVLGQWQQRCVWADQLLGSQVRRAWFHQGAGARGGEEERHGQHHLPGYIGTKMVMAIRRRCWSKILPQIPLGRLGKPEEVAGLIIYLASRSRLRHRRQHRHQRWPARTVMYVGLGSSAHANVCECDWRWRLSEPLGLLDVNATASPKQAKQGEPDAHPWLMEPRFVEPVWRPRSREPIPAARSRGLRGEACRSAQRALKGQSIESKP